MTSHPSTRATIRRLVATAAVVATISVGVVGCAQPDLAASIAAGPQRGGNLVYLDAEVPFGAQLQESGSWQDRGLLQNVTDRLLYRNPETNELEPWLAESWTVSEDGLTYEFVIRDGVSYSDGQELDVESVKTNLEFQIFGNPDNAISPNAVFPHEATITTDAATSTVTVVLPEPYAPFLGALTSWSAGLIGDATIALSRDEQLQYINLVGTGPFTVTKETYGKEIVLSRRDGYAWAPPSAENQGEAYLDTVTVIPVQEDSVRLGTLKSGQADLLRYLQPSEEQALDDAGFQIIAKSGVGLSNQWIIQQSAPFLDDINVRTALLVGIDRDQIIADVYTENWHAASSVVSPGTVGYADLSSELAYNPDEANRLLDESGWTERDADGYRTKGGERLVVSTYLDVFDISAKALFQHIQHQWKELGVELTIGELDYSTYWDTAFSDPNTGVLRTGWPHPDPVSLNANYSATASNLLKVNDPEFEQLLAAHVTAVTDEDRAAKLETLQRYIVEQAYVIPLLDDSQVYVARDAVQGFFLTDGALPTFQGTWLAD